MYEFREHRLNNPKKGYPELMGLENFMYKQVIFFYPT